MKADLSGVLVGRYFYSFSGISSKGKRDTNLRYQGRVIAPVNHDYVLVQLYDWLTGSLSDQKIVAISTMVNWNFYKSVEDWKEAFTMFVQEL